MSSSGSDDSSSGSGSEEEDSYDSEEEAAKSRQAWALLTQKKKEALCQCGLVPCLCQPKGSTTTTTTTTAATSSETKEAEAPAVGLVLNPEDDASRHVLLDERLASKLKPHQVGGVRFLWKRAMDATPRGCILADHMGLGKTLQLISVLAAYFAPLSSTRRARPSTRRALVIAPAFVLSNWEAEIAKWAPKRPESRRDDPPMFATVLKARRLPPTGGSKAQKVETLRKWRDQGGTLLMGYEMYRQLATATKVQDQLFAEIRAILCDPGPGLVVLDEAHRLKEPKSQLYASLELLSTKRRILASGYPIQNRLDEYWALVAFARPDALGPYDQFKHFFEKPIHRYVEARTEENEEDDDDDDEDLQIPLQTPTPEEGPGGEVPGADGGEETGGEDLGEASLRGRSETEARLALKRAFVLQRQLEDVVLRRGQDELGSDLPPRTDWLVHCRLSRTQTELYRAFEGSSFESAASAGGELAAYHTTLAIVNHPDIVHRALLDEERAFEGCGGDDTSNNAARGAAPAAARSGLFSGGGAAEAGTDEWSAPEVLAAARKAREEKRARDEAKRDKLRKKVAARLAEVGWSVDAILPDDVDSDDASGANNWSTELATWARPVLRPLSVIEGDGGYASGEADGDCGSGKAAVAVALIAAARKRRERVVVFTQTLGTLDVLERLLERERLTVARIDGATPTAKRAAIVAGFNPRVVGDNNAASEKATAPAVRARAPKKKRRLDDQDDDDDECDVLLMSIKAGGEGINLVGASRVILFDVCWNPCFDQQALSRAHRFGQRKHVHVYRLVGPEGTMEDRVLRQQRRKELLVQEVAGVGVSSQHGRSRLRRVFGLPGQSPRVDDALLGDVLTALGTKWVAAVHQSDSASDEKLKRDHTDKPKNIRALLTDDDKALALDDYANFKANLANNDPQRHT